jgi:hypothetical protein
MIGEALEPGVEIDAAHFDVGTPEGMSNPVKDNTALRESAIQKLMTGKPLSEDEARFMTH